MAVLYQKYRPQTFGEVIGQEPIVQTLRNAAESGDLAHAYLFTGSRGVGKTTIARLLAKAANCEHLKKGDPDGTCANCVAIANGSSLDVIEIDAASHTGVDNVRELIEHAQFRPAVMKTKVFIIDEVHMLSKAAFNALLKTLEEPPKHVMFILATTDIEKVPDTITSRTQRFDFKRIASNEMIEAVKAIAKDQKLNLPDGAIEAVVDQSEGSMRDALSRLGMLSSLGSKITLEDAQRLLGITSLETVQQLITAIVSHTATNLPEFFDTALASGADPAVLNRSVLQYLRQVLNYKLTGNLPTDSNDLFKTQAEGVTLPQLLFIIRLFLRSYKELSSAPSPELPLLLASIEASLHGVTSTETATEQPRPVIAQAQVQSKTQVQEKTQSEPEKTTSKLEIQTDPEAFGPTDTTVTMADIQGWWPDVISRIKTENSPIATLLKNSPIIDVINGKITVAVKYLFHKEHLDNKKHKALIIETISAVSGKNLQFNPVITKSPTQPSIAETVDSLNDALKVFGGELIE